MPTIFTSNLPAKSNPQIRKRLVLNSKLNNYKRKLGTPDYFVRVVLIFLIIMTFLLAGTQAQLTNIPVTGFNNDIVANGGAASGTPNTGLTYPSIGCDGAGYTLVQQGYTAGSATPSCFMPVSNTGASLLTPGLSYSFQGYGTSTVNNNNALTLNPPSSTYTSPFPVTGTLALTTPASYTKIYALVLSVCNNSTSSQTMSATVTFTDASTEVFAGNSFANWFSGSAATTAFNQFNRVNPNNGGFTNVCTATGYTTQPNMFQLSLSLSPENFGKQVSSITFTATTAITGTGSTPDKVNYLHILSVGGLTTCAIPSAQPTSLIAGTVSTSQVSADYTAAAGGPANYLTVRYANGATPTAPTDGTGYTAGQPLGAGTVVQSSNATSFTASGLSGSTTYDFYVYSFNSGSCGGPIYLTASPLTGSFATNSCGSLSGTIPVGPTAPASPAGFPTLTAALAYINSNGLGAATILELQPDYTTVYAAANETYPLNFPVNPCINSTRPLTIRPEPTVSSAITLTSSNTTGTVILDGGSYITIDGRPGGSGLNKFISIVNSSTTAGAAGNAILLRNEASNNTFTYLDVQSANANPAANTAVLTGGAIPGAIAIGTTSGINGNDNNTISFCDIHSTGANLGAGIYAGNSTTAGAPSNNDNNIITGNNIYDFFLAGAASAAVNISLGNNNFTINNNRVYQTATRTFTSGHAVRAFWITPNTGSLNSASGFTINGNTIGYNSAAGTGIYTMTGTTAWTFTGMDISVGLGTTSSVQDNVITNINSTSGNTTSGALVGINVANGNVDVGTTTGNIIGSATSNAAISFTATANAGGMLGIRVGAGGTINIANNTIAGIDLLNSTATVTTVFNGIASSGGTTVNITNNTVGSTTVTNSINAVSASTSSSVNAIRGIFVNGGTTSSITGNVISNLNTNYSATGTQGSTLGGIYVSASSCTVNNNTISNLTSNSQTTASGITSAIVGIAYSSTTSPLQITGNNIHSLRLTNPALTAAAQITGIYVGGSTSGSNTVSKNNLHSFSLANGANTAVVVTGITVGAGATNYFNNMVRLGYDASGNPVTAGVQFRGITKGINAVNNFYYNSIFIGGTGVISSSLNSFAFQRSTAPSSGNDIIQNNIFVNNRSNATAGGKHYVFSAAAANLLSLNYNVYQFTGTGGVFGLNVATDVPAYTTSWVGGDANSVVGNPQFLNPTGTATTGNLHLNNAVAGVAESLGTVVAGINEDLDGDSRQGSGGYAGTGTAPDAGADEYEGISAIPMLNSLLISPNTVQCTAVPHMVSANITAATGSTINSVTINYSVNGVAQTGVAMTLTSGSANATSVWEGDIPVPSPANATITWSVTVNDAVVSKTFTGSAYSDAPLTGAVVTISGPSGAVCAGTPSALSAIINVGKAMAIGSQTSTNGSTGTPYRPGSNGIQVKTQYLLLASELTAAGFTAGDFTKLAFTITSTTGTNANMEIRMAHTSATVLNSTFQTAAMQTVFTAATFTPVVGLNTHMFTNGFTWDGTSNILIELRHVNVSTGTSSTAAYNPGFANCTQVASSSGFAAATGTAVSIRPVMTLTQSTITNYTWNDGVADIGTGNPFTVSPLVNTSYTVNATDPNGCQAISAPFVVSTNALPAPPNGNNSSQCGLGAPMAFVTSGGGGGGFKWYDAQTGGNLLQTGGAQYTGAINTTTVFWVSESDGTCESVRTQVTANVVDADDISAMANTPQACLNAVIQLTAANIAASPVNNYTYTWTASPATGSGMPDPVTGNSPTITPTEPGTYTYTVTALDGGCTAAAQVVVTVNPLPVVSTVTAVPTAICPGASSNLQAMILTDASFAQVGTQSTTLTSLGNPYSSNIGIGNQVKTQMIFTVAELNSAGLSAGAFINSLGFTTTAAAGSITNLEIRLGHTSAGSLTTTFNTSTTTEVFNTASFTPVVGLNTHLFQSPFTWNGTSNLLVEVRQVNTVQGTTTIAAHSPGFTANVQAASSNALSATTGSTSSFRPIMRFNYTNNVSNTATWNWEPGTLAGNTVVVSPVSTTTYTVTATLTATGCTGTNQVTVTINDFPAMPSANNSEQCGTGIPSASVSSNSGATSPVFNWYDEPTGGNLLQSGTFSTYQLPVAVTTIFYVSEISTFGCEGPRVPLTVTLSEADAIIAVVTDNTVCIGNSFDINGSYVPAVNNYTIYTLEADGQAGSGVTGTVSLVANATGSDPFTITPTAAGTYTYTITANDPDKGCTAAGSITVTVDALPQVTTASASPATICAGNTSTLSATSISSTTLTATIGAGATDLTSFENPFRNSNANKHIQLMVRASELTTAGFAAGNISQLAFDISSIDATFNSYTNFSIKLTQTATTTVSSFITSGLTQVFFASTYTEVVGINNFVFTTPFAWNGTSNLVVDICYGDATINQQVLSNCRGDLTAFTSVIKSAIGSATSSASICSNTTSNITTSASRPSMTFVVQTNTNVTSSYNWVWNPGNVSAGTSGSATVNPAVTTTFTVTATSPATGCSSNSLPVTVTVNQLPGNPVASHSTQCGLAMPTASVTTGGGGNGIFNWYAAPTGGPALQTGTSTTFNTALSATTTFYVSELSPEDCESDRTPVTVTVTPPPAIDVSASTTVVCLNSSVNLDVASAENNYSYTWTASPSVGSGVSGSLPGSSNGSSVNTILPTAAGAYTYTVTASESVNGCTTTATVVTVVNPNPVIAGAGVSPATICTGGTATLTAIGATSQYSAVAVTGFNNDIVANGIGATNTATTGTTPGVTYPAIGVDGNLPTAYTFVDNTYKWHSGTASFPTCGLPANNKITSSLTAGLTYDLQSYSGYNSLTVASNTYAGSVHPTTGTFNLVTPASYSKLFVLYETVLNTAGPSITATVNFTDASTQVFAGNTVVNWFTNTGTAYSNMQRAGNTAPGAVGGCGSGPYLFQLTLSIDPANYNKAIQSITFSWSAPTGSSMQTVDYFHAMAVGAQAAPGNIQNTHYNWTWNPGNITDSVAIVSPTITTDYIATVVNPVTGCSASSAPVTLTVSPVGANATASVSAPVCVGTSVTLNAGATGGAPFTYSWNDGISVFSTAASVAVTPPVTTTYTVTVTDVCGNSATSPVTITVNALPTASIQEGPGPISVCDPATQLLTAVTDAASPTYQWTLNGNNISSATGATYTVNGVGTGTYRVVITNTDNGCVSVPSAGVLVTVNQTPAAITITPSPAVICSGGPQTLVAAGGTIGGTTTGTITGINPSTSTSPQSPFYRTFEGSRKQYLITAVELTNMGMVAGNQLTSLSFNVTALSRTTNIHHNNFNIKIAATSLTTLSSSYQTTGLVTVFGPVNYSPVLGANVLNFSSSFTWNGTSNIVVDVCFDNDPNGTCSSGQPVCWSNAATVSVATAATGSVRYYSADLASGSRDMCTIAGSPSSTNSRPVMVFGYSTVIPAPMSWTPATDLNTTSGNTVIASPTSPITYTVTATSPAGCTASASVDVTVNPRPTATISGTAMYCEGQNTATDLSIDVAGAGPWSGTLSDGTAFSGSNSPIIVSVSPSTTTTYTIATLIGQLCPATASELSGSATVTVHPLAATPTVAVIQPDCSTATGAITVTDPLGAGNVYTLDGSTSITWPTITFSAVAPGTHTISVSNSFGCASAASTTATVNPQPFTPATPVITGVTNVCPYLGTGETQTYTATTTGNGTTTYTWTLPPNVNLVAGGGTNTTNNFVTVSFNTGLSNPAQANKQIRLTATNQCGTSSIGVFYLLTQFPVTPAPITGPANVCALIGTATTATYTINKVTAALSYSWSVPSNAIATHPNGSGVNDTTIVVTFPVGFTGGTVSVTATNGCGSSGLRTLSIVNTPPSTPALIAGPTNVCAHIAPTGTVATYSITPVTNATSYTWTAPAGAVITHPNGPGVNDNTITVLFPAGFTSGTISVTATNGCGTSGVRSLSVTRLNPGTPGVIDVVQTQFCGDQGGRKFTYAVASMPANATSITWTVPLGATFVIVNPIKIEVTYPDAAVSGTVTAQSVNNCGTSSTRSTNVLLPACPTEFSGSNNNSSSGTVKGITAATNLEVKPMEVKIFPNPSVSDFRLEVFTSRSEEINVRVLDNLGKLYKSFRVFPNQVIALGAELKAGSYFIEVRQGKDVKTTKVIKF